LYLTGNQIKEVGPLGSLSGLSSLYLGSNQISNVEPLGKLTRLTLLSLKQNEISDIKPLGQLKELNMLFLEKNKITDLAPLVASAKADAAGEKRFAPFLRLYLGDNPLSDAAKNDQIKALKEAGVRVEF